MTDRKLARIVFEPVAEPCKSEDGRWWYEEPWGNEVVSYSAMPQPHAGTPLRRTVEYHEPTWRYRVGVKSADFGFMAQIALLGYNHCDAPPTITLNGPIRKYWDECDADITRLKGVAAEYARAYGASPIYTRWYESNPQTGESE